MPAESVDSNSNNLSSELTDKKMEPLTTIEDGYKEALKIIKPNIFSETIQSFHDIQR